MKSHVAEKKNVPTEIISPHYVVKLMTLRFWFAFVQFSPDWTDEISQGSGDRAGISCVIQIRGVVAVKYKVFNNSFQNSDEVITTDCGSIYVLLMALIGSGT